MKNTYLVWLEWPEKCFRVDAKALLALRKMVPKGSEIIRVKSEKSFLGSLPLATHAIVWNFNSEWFSFAKKLRVLATPSAGMELLPRIAPKGVTIHFGGFHGKVISETVIGMMLSWCRGIVPSERLGFWHKVDLSNHCYSLSGTRAVIIGYGKIGKYIGERLSMFGVEVVGLRRNNIQILPKVVANADWVILALPGDTGTDNIINSKIIAKLPKKAIVINIGRGNAIDETALLSALRRGKIAAACLDVYKNEPLTKDNPIGKVCHNIIHMPHSAAFYPEYIADCFEELKECGLLR